MKLAHLLPVFLILNKQNGNALFFYMYSVLTFWISFFLCCLRYASEGFNERPFFLPIFSLLKNFLEGRFLFIHTTKTQHGEQEATLGRG